jgi:hypothetical protein
MINLSEQKRAIKIATLSASGCYSPPWRLEGQIQRNDSETIEFSLKFFYKDAEQVTQMVGEWKKATTTPQWDPSMTLDGWSLYTLGGVSIKNEGSTILDYGAQSNPTKLRTLGELQESIRKQEGKSKDRR